MRILISVEHQEIGVERTQAAIAVKKLFNIVKNNLKLALVPRNEDTKMERKHAKKTDIVGDFVRNGVNTSGAEH